MSIDREILAEIHFNNPDAPDQRVICLCTRIFLKNSFPIYASTLGTEETSEADDVFNEKADLSLFRDSSKLKNSHENENCDNDANSCYYSASHTEHTDNYYSTDEHENIFQHTKLHSSDSGADLSEKNAIEKHMESVSDEQQPPVEFEKANDDDDDDVMTAEQEPQVEYHHERNNSLPELFGDEAHQASWEKYWAKNGERLIWQSWIEKYIDYINPEYLDINNMPLYENESSADSNRLYDDGNIEQIFTFDAKDISKMIPEVPSLDTEIVISPPAKQSTDEDLLIQGWNQLSPESLKHEDYHEHHRHQHHHHHHHRYHRQHSNEIDNLLSPPRCDSLHSSIPLTIGTSDSMTNVTQMTISSYGFGSSHVTSDSTPSTTPTEEDGNTISSLSESEEESDNQMTTRIANECEKLLMENKPEEHILPSDKDSEEYWQMRWQSHAQEQYVKHYNEFMEAHRMLQDEMSSSFKSDSGCLPGDGACASGVGGGKFNKRRRKSGRKKGSYSLQRLVANLNLRNDFTKYSEKQKAAPSDGTDDNNQHHHDQSHSDSTVIDTTETSLMESMGLPTTFGRRATSAKNGGGNGGDEPPDDDRPINLKRSHESDNETSNKNENNIDHVKSQFDLMGYAFSDTNDNTLTAGEIVYRKKHVRLHNRMLKMLPSTSIKPKHTFFDDDGNEIVETSPVPDPNIHTSSDEDIPVPTTTSQRLNSSIVPFTSQLSSDGNPNEGDEIKEELVNINLSIDQDYDSNYIEEVAVCDEQHQQLPSAKKEKKKKRKGKQLSIPVEIANDKDVKKFWYKRFSLFSMFDFGIRLDRESWFSVTPEKVAAFTAERCKCDIVIDAFCGVGGNCIQLAKTCEKVIAIDIDPKKIEMARHNATIYGVQDKIEFIVGNFLDLTERLKADVVFLAPPWGGPSYMRRDTIYDLEESLLPLPASKLLEETRKITENIAIYLPRNSNTKQLAIYAGKGNAVEIEQNFLDRKLVALTAYYGKLVQGNIMTSQK